MDASSSDSENSPPRARILWTLAKWLLFVVVILAVGYRGWTLWYKVDTKTLQLHYGWLFAAVLLYTAAWVPALIYWRWLMVAVGDKIPVLQVARAYYCGHLGKYVPGKAGVILIRATMIAGAGGKFGRAALTAGYEALTTISTGVAVALMLAPWIFPGFVKHPDWDWFTSLPGYPYVVPLLVALICLALLPMTAKLFAKLAAKFSKPNPAIPDVDQISPTPISSGLLFRGGLLMLVCWCVLGLSLGCIIRGTGMADFDLSQWPLWTAAVAAAITGGFLAVFAPGGLGVREVLLFEALKDQLGPQAVAVAVLMRVVSMIGELSAAAVLWRFGPRNSGAKQ